ncbi:iron-containing alcohol dehydrogenase [Psychromonas sp. MME1]|uniref:iron-containing alcohol dehydrogenase n=1 Tax=Psychromonas sp. MME1 TaxID=3231032 RepID=UPI0034E30116
MSFALKMPKLSLTGVGATGDSIIRLKAMGSKKALLVTDRNLIQLGVLDELFASLKNQQLDYVLFDEVTPNPTVDMVNRGKDIYLQEACDSFIAVGGGSPIDCAKAIRIITSNEGNIQDFNGIEKVKYPGDFFVAINTTSGTAAEMTSNSVITDTKNRVKMVIIDDKQIPDIAVNDPTLMLGLPAHVTAATGMDALTHAIEAYVTPSAHALTEPTALEAIKLINIWLPKAVSDGQNLEAREKLACAQYLAGMAFNSAGLGLVHAMAHQPGATHNLPHGVCNAILLPIVCEYNAEKNPERFRAVAEALGGDTSKLNDSDAADLAVLLIQRLSNTVAIPAGFKELGITSEDITSWIDKAMIILV